MTTFTSRLAAHISELTQQRDLVFSDIHIEEGHPVMARTPMGWIKTGYEGTTTAADVGDLIKGFDESWSAGKLTDDPQFESAATIQGVRLRCSAYLVAAGKRIAVTIRKHPAEPRPLADLGLPPSVDAFASVNRGLLIVSGRTGAGKTTTLAAIIRRINETRAAHILTIEDPIEYVFKRDKSIISQREVGADVDSFSDGLHGALRQSPDVIMIGEIRDRDAAETALLLAESGHFVMASTHARNATSAIAKLLAFFPDEQASRSQLLASALVGVIAQTLPANTSGGRSVAAEVLHVKQPKVMKAIAEQKLYLIDEALKKGELAQCTHMNTILARMVGRKEVTPAAALAESPHPEELSELLQAARAA